MARADGAPIAVMPLYAKSHSQGEYIFDHNWAHAWERAGGRYYPKLQAAVPFTPATGRRFLTRPGHEVEGRAALLAGRPCRSRGRRRSRACTSPSAPRRSATGARPRASSPAPRQQFHWHNRGYADFEAFLADLSSRKRKTIRKERERARAFGGDIVALTGDAIEPAHWDAFWRFYQDTGSRKWGHPYLTRAFFDRAQETHARRRAAGPRPAARALGGGRAELHRRAIRSTAATGAASRTIPSCTSSSATTRRSTGRSPTASPASRPGAQGEHKLARGYLPAAIHSLHWIADPGFARAVAQYLEAETRAVDEEIEVLTAYGPFRRRPPEECDAE